jgi:hypothetical protein
MAAQIRGGPLSKSKGLGVISEGFETQGLSSKLAGLNVHTGSMHAP